MTKTKRSPVKLPPLSEQDWQDKIVTVARHAGWRVSHFAPARTEKGWVTPCRYDGKGFVDCVFVHPFRGLLLFVEFKTETGETSDDQDAWADWLEAIEKVAPDVVRYFIWRPHAEAEIIEYLTDTTERETA